MNATESSVPRVGALLGGRFRVLAKLGEGGMGTVFRAENVVTGKLVALKWMHPHVGVHSDAAARLLREAQAAARLNHPNIVDVYDIVQTSDALFLVMELLTGETLRTYLDREPKPPLSSFIALILPALHGVAAAHEVGVIHRDLKPDNIFLCRESGAATPNAKVLDFGVAKIAGPQLAPLTGTGGVVGTPQYMALEQLRGAPDVDARADVYALGVILYEAITGRPPFDGRSFSELVIKVATTEPLSVRKLRPDVPAELARLVDRALAREREQRLPSVQVLVQELQRFADDESPASSEPARIESPRRHFRHIGMAAGACAVLAMLIAGYLWTLRARSEVSAHRPVPTTDAPGAAASRPEQPVVLPTSVPPPTPVADAPIAEPSAPIPPHPARRPAARAAPRRAPAAQQPTAGKSPAELLAF